MKTTEPLPFGIYGGVLEEGEIRVGDQVELLDQ
jgi:MOSC domain-containing protein YiiM